jgi:hypothetical protein
MTSTSCMAVTQPLTIFLVKEFSGGLRPARYRPSPCGKECLMDRADVSRWLERYVAAWRSNDREQIVALFTPDARYRYTPYDAALEGAEAIADSWLEDPDDPAVWEASYEPVAVDGSSAVAAGTSRYRATAQKPERTYHNCFVLRFAGDGRCAEFTEWYMLAPRPVGEAA